MAEAIVAAVRDALPGATIVGQSGGALVAKAVLMKLRAANEVFADRGYRPDGSLQPRDRPNAVITDPTRAADRIAGLLQTGAIEAIDGSMLTMPADTVCVHGDNPRAVRVRTNPCKDLGRDLHGVVLLQPRQMNGLFRVIQPGLLTTMQSLGRYGRQQFGVAPGGAADSEQSSYCQCTRS